MSYFVTTGDSSIVLHETDTVREIVRNVAVVLGTQKGSVPLYRDFGIDWDFLDKPLPVAQTMMHARIREALETFEPRIQVVGITFAIDADAPATLIPTVEIEIL